MEALTTSFDTREIVVNMGPQHPSTHGVLRVILRLDGEMVVDADCVIGYLHRGCEKLGESRMYHQMIPTTDRLDYIAAISNNLCYCETVEKLYGIKAPPRAQYVRVILAELTRISSHLLWLATHALDIGAMTVFIYCFREREHILDIFEGYCGARLTNSALRVGGLPNDIQPDFKQKVKEFCDILPARIEEYEGLLTKNRIWMNRTIGVGILKPQDAIDLGVSGPTLRGSGVDWDVRKSNPYACYDEFEFDIPLGKTGDTYDRYLCRIEEMRQSRRIILQALERMPEGEIRAKLARTAKPPAGEVYHTIEAPKGQIGWYLVSDGSQKAYRWRVRAPSFVNLQALAKMVKGQLVADVVAVIGSIDIVLGEVDR
ncbi:MAG: NADH-quinone oxidoreductase subunit D [Acidobacteriota bacterium]